MSGWRVCTPPVMATPQNSAGRCAPGARVAARLGTLLCRRFRTSNARGPAPFPLFAHGLS
eukprot:scaffold2093_cov425-Prasinococcus_capsulatus_cf.AAC.8